MAAVYSNPTRGFNPNTHALFGCGAQPGLSRLLMQELFASIPEAARERPVAIGEMIDSVLVHLQQPPGASYPLFESFFEPHEAPAQAKPHLLHHPAEWGNVIVIQKHGTAFLTGYAYAGEDALLGRALSEVAGRVALHMPAVTRLWVQTHHEQTFGDQPSLARFKDIDIDGTPLRLGPGEWRRRGFELGRPTEFDAFAPRHLRDETLTLGALPDFTLAQSFLLDKGFRTRQALPLKKREPIDLNLYGNRLQLHPIGPGYATVTGELPLGNDINAWMELL
ncbi:MAG TPA: hypothetical protein VHB73_08285, partial [Alphaproteobacteria bacterium]|nr:hypothetical protein [Alphaproteobacteria bacterium]